MLLSREQLKKQREVYEQMIPEADLVRLLFEHGYIKIARSTKTLTGVSVITEMNVPEILKAIGEYAPVFKNQRDIYAEIADHTVIDDPVKIKARLEQLIAEIPQVLQREHMLTPDYEEREHPLMPIGVEYDPQVNPEKSVAVNPVDTLGQAFSGITQQVEKGLQLQEGTLSGNKSTIRLGGKFIQYLATTLREHLDGLTPEESIDLALYHTFAHEYGHHILAVYANDAQPGEEVLFGRSRQVQQGPFDVEYFERQARDIFAEWFSQSVAAVLLQKFLETKSWPTGRIHEAVKTAGRENPGKLQKLMAMSGWAAQHGYTLAHIEAALVRTRLFLVERGHKAEAYKLVIPWREAGYWLPAFTEEQLRFMICGKSDKPEDASTK